MNKDFIVTYLDEAGNKKKVMIITSIPTTTQKIEAKLPTHTQVLGIMVADDCLAFYDDHPWSERGWAEDDRKRALNNKP